MPHTLLVADESATIQRVVELTFAAEDVRVVTVADGEQAIARVQSERPDIVLAEIAMRKPSGYDVAAFIKGHAALSHIPVLLLAGAFEAVDDQRVRDSRGDGVLVKPFEPREVIERVRALLGWAAGSVTPEASEGQRPVDLLRQLPSRLGPATEKPPAETRQPSPVASRALDDYFDQLDAALAARAAAGAAAPTPPPEATASIAEAFSALLAVEQGEPGARPVRLTPRADQHAVDDAALIERTAQRVIERLGDETVREVVADVVPGLVERLVHEELHRLRTTAAGQDPAERSVTEQI